jgi:hypothetical protein
LSVIHDHCSFLLQPLFMMGIVERGYLILVHLLDYNIMSYTGWMWWTHGVHVGTNLDDRPFIEPSTAITTACHSIKLLCLCWHCCINRRVNLYPIIMQSNHIDWTAVFAVLPIMALQQFMIIGAILEMGRMIHRNRYFLRGSWWDANLTRVFLSRFSRIHTTLTHR